MGREGQGPGQDWCRPADGLGRECMKRRGEWRGKGSGELWGPPMLEGKV